MSEAMNLVSDNDLLADVWAALAYNPETGLFTWKIKRANKRIGDVGGCGT
jgi:hypothetical protein